MKHEFDLNRSTMTTAIMNWIYGAVASIRFSVRHRKLSKNGTFNLMMTGMNLNLHLKTLLFISLRMVRTI